MDSPAPSTARHGRRTPDLVLTTDELRAVTAFALAPATEVLPLFEADRPGDARPREALEAAARFVAGEPRSQRLRVAATAAHRSARESGSPVAFHAAMAAGDAAASAYLHPLADAVQVGHILRAAAHALCAFEVHDREEQRTAERLERLVGLATPVLVAVLHRYPRVGPGRNRVGELMADLDARLREAG